MVSSEHPDKALLMVWLAIAPCSLRTTAGGSQGKKNTRIETEAFVRWMGAPSRNDGLLLLGPGDTDTDWIQKGRPGLDVAD
jgi:hypothetical protein